MKSGNMYKLQNEYIRDHNDVKVEPARRGQEGLICYFNGPSKVYELLKPATPAVHVSFSKERLYI